MAAQREATLVAEYAITLSCEELGISLSLENAQVLPLTRADM
jgi:hypothetical protein